MRRSWVVLGLLTVAAVAFVTGGAPLLLGTAMLSPALALALPLWLGRYPGAERLERRRRVHRPRAPRADAGTWRRFRRPAPFCAPTGPLLGISLAVRPPPA